MKLNMVVATAAAGIMLAAPLAQAGDRGRGHYSDGGVDYAEVLEARPIYREVRVPQEHEECYEERVNDRRYRGDRTASTLLGGVIGLAIGNQIGNGSGRDAARVAGAVIGASVGNQVARDHERRHDGSYTYQTRCTTAVDYRYEHEIEGYEVTYRYNGYVGHTTWPHDPGDRIPVDVNVRPVRDYRYDGHGYDDRGYVGYR